MSRKNKLQIKVGPVFKKNAECQSKIVVNVGGARSGKSYAVAQLLLLYAGKYNGVNIAVTRKTMPALKMTAYRLIIDLLKKYGMYYPANHNKSEHFYLLGESRIQFFSLDDPEKIKSSEFNYIWMEEASEFTYADYIVLLTRLSAVREGVKNQIFLTLNPSDSKSWIAKKLLTQKEAALIESNYQDNPFLSQDYIGTLLSLKDYDENAYNVFALGKWGQNSQTVYTHYRLADSPPADCDDIIWGLDFGFNNPSALVKIYIKDGVFTVQEVIYQSGLTNTALIEKMLKLIPPAQRGQTIYADCAEPDRIAEIAAGGFNIHPAVKSVNNGILSVKSVKLDIVKGSVNLIKEIQNYCWKTDINGNVLEEPVKFNDHALDALRYALHTYRSQTQMQAPPDISFF